MARTNAHVAKPATKSEIFAELADRAGLQRKQVSGVFDALATLIGHNLGRKGPGVFVLPGLVKLRVVRKPATKERPGVNPFTGEQITIKAKPARNVVRATPLKKLKDMV